MSVTTPGSRAARRALSVVTAVALVVAGAVLPVSNAAAAPSTLAITPLGWNVVGLDSNGPTSATGPARYAVGAKVCNTGAAIATSVDASWAWLSSNSHISILGAPTKSSADLAIGACRYMWWTVDIERVAASHNTTRAFQITASATNAPSVKTPVNREIYVEKLVSQNRNSVTGSSGPTSVYVGSTYSWTFSYDTGAFNQVQAGAFLDPSIFEISSVSQTYTTGGANDQFYKDACSWINDTSSGSYRSCATNVKAGGTITSTVTARVTGVGTSKISPLVLDFSGSSYHYNTDYAASVYALTVTATNPPAPTATADTAATTLNTTVDIAVLANDVANAGSLDAATLSITGAASHGTATIVSGQVRYVPTTGYSGTDSFTYRICTTLGACATATVTVTISAPPVAVSDTVTASTAVATSIGVLLNDSSPAGYALSITSVGTPSHGSAAITGATVTYTSVAGYHGADSFTYSISDGNGGTATATVGVTVVNAPPVASDDSATTSSGTLVAINVRGNDTDPNGDVLTITSLGSPGNGTAVIASGAVSYTPTAGFKGTDSFTYTVSDGFGGTASATVTVSVANATPVAANDSATTPGGAAIDIAVLANDSDPNLDTLSISNLTSPSSGTVSVVSGVVRYTPVAGFRGIATFTYTATDGTGTSAPATVTITVGNTPPVAGPDTSTTHDAVTIDVLANDSDPNADPLTVTATGPAGNGIVTVNGGGTLTYTPNAGFTGTDSFTYTISDGQGGTSSATVTVTVTNVAPVATDDLTTLPHGPGASTTYDVLADDTDADGDALSLDSVSGATNGVASIVGGKVSYTPDAGFVGDEIITYTISDGHGGTDTGTLTVRVTNAAPTATDDSATTATDAPVIVAVLVNDTDPNGDALTVSAIGTAANGTVQINGDGTISYTPDASFRGTDTFTYTVSDGFVAAPPATVTITVLNAAPLATADSVGTPSATAIVLAVLANDTDANNDVLTVTAVGAAGDGTVVANGDGTITYTPDAGFKGTDTFSYTISDGAGGTSTATVTVVVADAGPVAVDDSASTRHDVSVAVSVLVNDTDANPSDILAISSVSIPGHGTAQIFGQQVVYTPDAGYTGPDSFTYIVTDFDGGIATGTVTITVTNDAPVAIDDQTTMARGPGASTTYDVLADDTDADGDVLSLDSVSGATNGVASIVGGVVSYTPDAGFVGDDVITYTISDGFGGTDTGTLTVHVTNDPPTALDDAATTPGGTAIDVAVLTNDTDPNLDTLSISNLTSPSSGTVSVVSGVVRYTPVAGFRGITTFTYTATDGTGTSAPATVTVTVGNTPPVAAPDIATTHGAVTVDVLANDSDPNADTLTVTTTGPAGNGVVTVNGDGTLTYTPNAGFTGTDSFTYTISDGDGGTATATVTITVVNAPPAAADDSAATADGIDVLIDVRGNDTDPDADTLVISSVGTAGHGTAVISSGQVRYSPTPGFSGTDSFSYTISDGFGGTSTATVTVSVADPTPIAADDSASTAGGTPVDITVLGNDTDPGALPLSITNLSTAGHGTVSIVSGTVRYTPANGYRGIDTFTYTASNGSETSPPATVTVTVGNTPPVASADSASASAAITIDVLGNDTDGNGDTLTVSAAGAPSHGTVVVNGDGTITYTPSAGYTGTDSFTYTISDGFGGTSVATVVVTVTATAIPPVALSPTASPVCVAGAPYLSYTVVGSGSLSITWKDSTGRTVATFAGLSTTGTLLWPGAAVDGSGTASDWPGWILSSGVWVQGSDGYENTRAGSTLEFALDGATGSTTASYPAATSACTAAPRLTTSDDATSTASGRPVTVRVHGNDSGVDAGSQTSVATSPRHGVVTVNADGTVTYRPTAGFAGSDSFTYTVTNANGLVSTSTVAVVVGATTVSGPVSGPQAPPSDANSPKPPGSLSQSGADVSGLLSLGLLFVLAGALLRRGGRRALHPADTA